MLLSHVSPAAFSLSSTLSNPLEPARCANHLPTPQFCERVKHFSAMLLPSAWRDPCFECPAGNQVYSTEVQRWCPDRDCFAATQDQLPTGQADLFEVCSFPLAHCCIRAWLVDLHAQIEASRRCCRCFGSKALASAAISGYHSLVYRAAVVKDSIPAIDVGSCR